MTLAENSWEEGKNKKYLGIRVVSEILRSFEEDFHKLFIE